MKLGKKIVSWLLVISLIIPSFSGIQLSFADETASDGESTEHAVSMEELLGLDANSPISTTPANIQVLPLVDDMLNNYSFYNELSAEQKQILCDSEGLSDAIMNDPLLQNVTLRKAVQAASLSNQMTFTLKQALTLVNYYSDSKLLINVLQVLEQQINVYHHDESNVDSVIQLILLGYDATAASKAVYAAKTLELDVLVIIKNEHTYDISKMPKENVHLDGNEKYVLDQYHIDFEKIRQIEQFSQNSILDILSIIVNYTPKSKSKLIQASNIESNGVNTATSDAGNVQIPTYNKEYTAPFSWSPNGTSVSTFDGTLYTQTPSESLPGRNGFNVAIGLSYNSRESKVADEDFGQLDEQTYSGADYDVHISKSGVYVYRNGTYEPYGNLYYKSIGTHTNITFGRMKEITAQFPVYVSVGKDYIGNDLYEIYEATVNEEDGYNHTEKIVDKLNYLSYKDKFENVGMGWSWGFPSIEKTEREFRGVKQTANYLHLGNGQTYKIINYEDNRYKLENYGLEDISIWKDSTYTQSYTGKISEYAIYMRVGTTQYFAEDGTLMAMIDRYGNKIEWIYETVGEQRVLKKIIDTVGREIVFNETITETGKKVTVTFPDQRVMTFNHVFAPGYTTEYLLSEYIDPTGKSTKYNYLQNKSAYSFVDPYKEDFKNDYFYLNQIEYPTGGKQVFGYKKLKTYLGSSGTQEIMRVTSHQIIDSHQMSQEIKYEYDEPWAVNGSSHSTKVTSNNLIKTLVHETYGSVYNEITTTLSGKLLSNTFYHHDDRKQLKGVKKYIYNLDNNNFSEINEIYTYNSVGDLIYHRDADGIETRNEYGNYHLLVSSVKNLKNSNYASTYFELGNNDKNYRSIKQSNIVDGVDQSVTTYFDYDTYGNVTHLKTQKSDESTETFYEYGSEYQGAYLTKTTQTTRTNGFNQGINEQMVTAETSYKYDFNNGRLIEIISPLGVSTKVSYDALGRVIQTNVDGTVMSSATYDDVNNSTTVTSASGVRTQYQYSALGRPLSTTNLDTGKSTKNIYNEQGQVIKVVDPMGFETKMTYDVLGRVIKTEAPDGSSQSVNYLDDSFAKIITDETGAQTYEQTDKLGQVIRVGKISNGSMIYRTMAYDGNGNVISETDYKGNKTTYAYDSLGNLLRVTNALGEVTTITPSLFGSPRKVVTAGGSVTSYEYDNQGRLLKTTNPVGKTEQFVYDKMGNVLYSKDYSGKIVQYQYDHLGRKIKEIDGSKITETVYDIEGRITEIKDENGTIRQSYSPDGLLLTKTMPDSKTITYTYDQNSRMVSMTDYFGKLTSYGYDSRNRMISVTRDDKVTQYSYYADGLLRQTIYPSGIIEVNTYTTDGLLATKVTTKAGNVNVSSYTYNYDVNGNRIYETGSNGTKTYTYDTLNRLTKVAYDNGNATSYTFDKNGNILTKYDEVPSLNPYTSKQTTYSYDSANKLIKTQSQLLHSVQFSQSSKTLEVTSNVDIENRSLNVGDSVTFKVVGKINGKPAPASQLQNLKITSSTNTSANSSNVIFDTSKLLVDGTVTMKYIKIIDVSDIIYRPKELSMDINFLWNGASVKKSVSFTKIKSLDVVVDGKSTVNGITTISMSVLAKQNGEMASADEFSSMVIEITPAEVSRYITVKQTGKVVTLNHDGTSPLPNVQLTFKWEGLIAVQSFTISNGTVPKPPRGTTPLPGLPKPPVVVMMYTPCILQAMNMSAVSANRTASQLVGLYTSSIVFEPIVNQVTNPQPETTTYTYDDNGNLTTESHTVGTQQTTKTYQYDHKNRMTAFKDPAGKVSTYAYYPDGLRSQKTVNGATTQFYYAGADIIDEAVGGQLYASNIRGFGLIGRSSGGHYYTFIRDGHGDVNKILDETGAEVSNYQYDAYGNEIKTASQTNTLYNPYRYSGEYFDEESGLYYLRARYYSPEIARFITQDTYVGSLREPLSLNLYAYCNGNPITFRDPSGHRAGDVFETRDEAAIDFATIYATEEEGVKNNFEWATYIYKNKDGKYLYLEPWHGEVTVPGERVSVKMPLFYKVQLNKEDELAAAIHTHGAYEYPLDLKFSVDMDMSWSGRRLTQLCPLYLANAAGELLLYDPDGFNPENLEEGHPQIFLIASGLPKLEGVKNGETGYQYYKYKKYKWWQISGWWAYSKYYSTGLYDPK